MPSKKDYEKTAGILQRFEKGLEQQQITNPVEFLIDEFAYWFEDNPRFDEKKFREAIKGA